MESLKKASDLKSITTKNKFVLVDFYGQNCGPCKKLSPILDSLEKEVTNVVFSKADVEDIGDLADELAIDAVPTMILYKDGKEVDRKEGLLSSNTLKNWLTAQAK